MFVELTDNYSGKKHLYNFEIIKRVDFNTVGQAVLVYSSTTLGIETVKESYEYVRNIVAEKGLKVIK